MKHWHRCARWWRLKMECPLLQMEEHDDLSEDPPDDDIEVQREIPQQEGQRRIDPPLVGDRQEEAQPPMEERGLPDVTKTTEDIVRETVPDDVPTPDQPGAEPLPVPIPVLPGPGPAPTRGPGRVPATVGEGGGARLGPGGTGLPTHAGRSPTGEGATPTAVSVAINRATQGLATSGAMISARAARQAMVTRPRVTMANRPPGAAQGRARSLANLRGVEQVGPGRSDMPARRAEINRVRAGVAEEATARVFGSRRLVGAMMTAGAGAQLFSGSRTGGRFSGRGRFRGGGAGFFFNQARQLRQMLSQR